MVDELDARVLPQSVKHAAVVGIGGIQNQGAERPRLISADHSLPSSGPPDCLCRLWTRARDRTTGNHREVHRKREFLFKRLDFGPADHRRQRQGGLEHREMITDARTRTAAERNVLPAIQFLHVVGAESVGIKLQRSIPQCRVALHGHPAEYQHRARPHPVTAHFDVPARHARSGGRRRAQPKRLPQHLDGVAQPWNIVDRQWAIRKFGDFCGDPVLVLGMAAERPHRVRESCGDCVMASEQEDDQLFTDLLIGQRLSGDRVPRGDQGMDERRDPGGVGTAGEQNLLRQTMHFGTCRPRTAGSRCRQPPRDTHRTHRTAHRIFQRHAQRLVDLVGPLVQIDSEHRTAKCPQG